MPVAAASPAAPSPGNSTPAPPASAKTAADLAAAQARAAMFDSVRAQLGAQLATALQTQDRIMQSLRDNAEQQTRLQDEMGKTTAKIAELEAEIARLDLHIALVTARIESEKGQIRSLARAIYAQPSSILLLLVESRSLGDMMARVNDLRSAGARAQTLKLHLKVDLASLDSDRRRQSAARDDQVKLRAQQVADLDKLKELRLKQEKAQGELAAQIDATRYELSRVDSQSIAIAKQVTELLQEQQAEIIAAAEESVWAQVQTIHPSGLPTGASAGHSVKYRFVWPISQGAVTQRFGPCDFWFVPPYGGYPHFHTGIDMSEPEGLPVVSADDGVVILAGASAVNGVLVGYGNYAVVAHADGLTTLYGHLQRLVTHVGDRLNQGQLIGFEGSTGNSTGAHLHFELRQGGTKPIDPAPFLPPGQPSDFRG
jgi:murein DD-endopeptidase MepM/ murein hydrolase activator NlpD